MSDNELSENEEEKQAPRMSVVVACRNESTAIDACIRSLLNQAPIDGGFEVIVADGMSTDGTREKLARLAQDDQRVVLIDNPRLSGAAGFNLGVIAARGEYVAIMGAHNRYRQDYLAKCLAVALRTRADNVGGAPLVEPEGTVGWAVALVHHSWLSVGGARWHDVNYEGYADTVFGGFFKRELFVRLGGYDESMVRTEDDEFNFRLRELGGSVYCSREIRSWYRPRNSFRAVFTQYLQYGYYRVAVIKKHGRPGSFRQIVPAFALFLLLLAIATGLVWTPALVAALLGVAIYTFVVMAAAIRSVLSSPNIRTFSLGGVKLTIASAVVFVCFHLGYAWGTIAGALDLGLGQHGRQRFQRITRT
jgi:succinoglycan biosynthesis protein ExoA